MIEKSKIKKQKSKRVPQITSSKNQKYFFLLLAILIIATFLRLWQLDLIPPGLYPDEAINGNEALISGARIFYPENNGREGLFINLISLSFSIFGPSIFSLRLVSAVIGILTIFGLYLFTRELFPEKRFGTLKFRIWNLFRISNLEFRISRGEIIALLSSLFLATSFWHINFSRLGFRAILVPFILVFSFYFLFRGLHTKKILDFVISGITFGLGFYAYTPFRLAIFILPFIFIPYWFLYKKQNLQKQFILNTLYFILATLIIALPLGLYFLSHAQYFISRAAAISVFAAQNPIKAFGESFVRHLAMFNFQGDPNWRHNFAGSPMLFWPIGILFLIGFFLSIKKIIISFKKGNYLLPTTYYLLLGWLFIMLLPGILTFEGIPHSLRVVGVIPVVYIFAALGGWQVYYFFEKNLKSKKLLILASILFLVAVGFFQFDKYFQKWARQPEVKDAFSEDYIKMGNYLNSLASDIEKYVIVNQPGVPVPYPEGLPMPAQTIMFVQETRSRKQETHYFLPENLEEIKIEKSTVILPMREDIEVFLKLWERFPEGKLERKQGFWIYHIY